MRTAPREVFRGDIIVVSCGAANTAKLLLMSANGAHPNGLANGSDQVGRNYMFHNSRAVPAISFEPNPAIFQKTIALNDFYFGMDGFEYPMRNIQMIGKSVGPMYRGEKSIETALLPLAVLDDLAHHALDFWLTTEDLPDPKNRVPGEDERRRKCATLQNVFGVFHRPGELGQAVVGARAHDEEPARLSHCIVDDGGQRTQEPSAVDSIGCP